MKDSMSKLRQQRAQDDCKVIKQIKFTFQLQSQYLLLIDPKGSPRF